MCLKHFTGSIDVRNKNKWHYLCLYLIIFVYFLNCIRFAMTGDAESVTVRRTEWSDAEEINHLVSPAAVAVFGRINVIHLL